MSFPRFRLPPACALGALLVLASGCDDADDDPSAQSSSTGSTGSGASGGSGATGGAGGSGASGGGGSGGMVPALPCTPDALPGAIADAAWDTRFTVPGVAGPDGDAPHVADFARDLDGTVLATGRFRWLGAERVKPLLRSDPSSGPAAWTEALDTWDLEPEAFGGISSIAVGPDGELALAPTGVAPKIWIDTGTGLTAIGALSGSSEAFSYVRSMTFYEGALWAAGFFTLATGESNLAVWDGTAWAEAPGGAPDGPAYDLLVDGDTLYVAGDFASIGGIPASGVASWNGGAWSALDMELGFSESVTALAMSPDGELFAGGYFGGDGSDCPPSGSVARWTGTSWEMAGAGVSMPDVSCGGSRAGFVYDLAFHQGALYATGVFDFANGAADSDSALPAKNFARYGGGHWESLDGAATIGVAGPWVFFGTEGSGIVGQRLFSDGDRLLAGILSAGVGGVASPGLIAYENGAWTPQGPAAGLGLLGSFAALTAGGPGCALHVLTDATHTAGQPLTSPALRFDGDAWVPIGGAAPEGLRCTDAIAVDPDGKTFIACVPDGAGAADVLASDGNAWTSIGQPEGAGAVMAMAIDPRGGLWAVGGQVGDGGGPSGGFVARWSDGAWTTVAEASAEVTHIAFAPDGGGGAQPAFVVGGGFSQLDGQPLARVAWFDGAAWKALGDGLQRPVASLAYGHQGIYASEQADGVSDVLDVGRFDGTSWEELATEAHGYPQVVVSDVNRIIEAGDTLIVAGMLYRGEFPPQERMVLSFDGTQFDWLHGGVAANFLSDAAITAEGLWFTGAIAEAGVGEERVSSVGIAHLGWSR